MTTSVNVCYTKKVYYCQCPNCGIWRVTKLHKDGTRTVRCGCIGNGYDRKTVWECAPNAPVRVEKQRRVARLEV